MNSLTYCLIVTGPHYGTEQASSAYLFANALIEKGHKIAQVFFYRDGVTNANKLVSPASDEFNLPKAWLAFAKEHHIPLQVCVAAALRRGIIDEQQAKEQGIDGANLASEFELSGLGSLAQTMLTCSRVVQF
ncbi:sulfurtransferase complex subunit TusD [Proteus hauseri]|uniref:sulfurtransferase complex subunit TusD n=1 Tax=Proteus hauseri TaxID=183417 RepID=UPI00100970C4|nr:sulfurtransferase complex subunit TusD [Proteus hauseri]QAV22841.1 sulfurtransferase complex subunit TusD [Proteus hauseri]